MNELTPPLGGSFPSSNKFDLPEVKRPVKLGVIPRGVKVGKSFHGTHKDSGKTALVRRSDLNDYAQFDDIAHAHAFGWHAYPLNAFEKIDSSGAFEEIDE